MALLGKTVRDVYEAMLTAYQVKDKKQGAKNALGIYEENLDFIEETRNTLVELDDLVDALRESLNVISLDRTKKTQIRKGSIVSKIIPCGKNCSGCKHGPYLYKVYRKDGKLIWEYLGKSHSGTEKENLVIST